MAAIYQATFKLDDIVYVTTASALYDLNEGFWVNADMEWTSRSDALYYILPHMIRKIEKVPYE